MRSAGLVVDLLEQLWIWSGSSLRSWCSSGPMRFAKRMVRAMDVPSRGTDHFGEHQLGELK